MAVDMKALVQNMKDAASGILKADITTLSGFSERQVLAIAQQADLVAAGILTGQITDDTRQFFLDGLQDMVKSFVMTLHGILMVTIEKVLNAMVGILWDALSKATGLALAVPSL